MLNRINTAHRSSTKLKIVSILLGVFVSTQCGAFEELGEVSKTLEPTPSPALQQKVGSKRISLRNGEERTYTLIEKDDKSVSWKSSDGCSWADPVSANNLFAMAPSLSWENCSGSSGHAKVKVKGELFPIKKGNKVVYSVSGTTTKGSWTGNWGDRRVCKVKGQVRVKTVSGEYDTWKVICKGKNDKRTNYYSPELGLIVAMQRKHYKDSSRNRISEWVRFE